MKTHMMESVDVSNAWVVTQFSNNLRLRCGYLAAIVSLRNNSAVYVSSIEPNAARAEQHAIRMLDMVNDKRLTVGEEDVYVAEVLVASAIFTGKRAGIYATRRLDTDAIVKWEL